MSFSNQKKQPFTFDPEMNSAMKGMGDIAGMGKKPGLDNMRFYEPFMGGGENMPTDPREAQNAVKSMMAATNGFSILGNPPLKNPQGGYMVPPHLQNPAWRKKDV